MMFLLFKVILLNTFVFGLLKYAMSTLVFFLIFAGANTLLEKAKENRELKNELLINKH
ncbi:hypothetical protein [Polaribacter sp. MED152]|uniref:hypothetical protein n=1 Tax=Polaribacter sp. MED152 TaxID=313598 RepID=UPI000068C800|nr:hypothetical protein [Polaribacter sp. MED152]EAQ41355.3 hypothetical protein MED152_01535 [Polaribacter sp. MED152]